MKSLLGYTSLSFIAANKRGIRLSGTASIHSFRLPTLASFDDSFRKPRANACMHSVESGGIPVTERERLRVDHDVDEGALVWLRAVGMSSGLPAPNVFLLRPLLRAEVDAFCLDFDILEHCEAGGKGVQRDE